MTKGRIAVRTNRANAENEKTFNLNGVKFTQLARIRIVYTLYTVSQKTRH